MCAHRLPARGATRRALTLALAISAVVMVAEAVGGWWSNSLALLADAGHMLTDVGALGLSLVMARLAERPATAEKTYGYLRLEILAALANGAVLFVIAGG
ncbi:MAG TPA: cation diffusion facilitator family transporter, partial [Gemmatimonadales bacterium]